MQNDKFWLRIIYILSTVISLAVAFLILGPRPEVMEGTLDVSKLPLLNAILNSITTLLLIFAFIMYIVIFIKFTYSGYKDIKNMLDK